MATNVENTLAPEDHKQIHTTITSSLDSAEETPSGPTESKLVPAVRELNSQEHIGICRAIGAFSDDEEKASRNVDVNKLPDGLYRNMILSRRKSQWTYKVVSFVYNFCLVLQLVLGAILTSLGASNKKSPNNIAITVLAAGNTVNAGIIALLHNSGLPGRYRNDWAEYGKVELFVSQLIHTGVVPKDMSVADIKQNVWTMYEKAIETVEGNKPASYIATVPSEKPK